MHPRRPKTCQDASKMCPRCPKMPPRRPTVPPRRDFCGFWEPKWRLVDTKIASTSDVLLRQPETTKCLFVQSNLMIFLNSEIDFRRQNRIKIEWRMTLRWQSQIKPSSGMKIKQQMPSRRLQNDLRRSKDGPRRLQDASKTPPRRSQDACKTPLRGP